jgi:putative phosphoribosyl transferase
MSNGNSRRVVIPAGKASLIGDLSVPRSSRGVVVFAHAVARSRLDLRNRQIALAFEQRNLGTLLFDLLTEEEDRIARIEPTLRLNVNLLADRLIAATDWIRQHPAGDRPIGYFAAGTGSAASITAAVARPAVVAGVVSRGGRPDLAGPALVQMRAPVLLIVGGEDPDVIRFNETAMEEMSVSVELVIVPGATHRFEQRGTLETVTELAADWFVEKLSLREAREHAIDART